MLEKLIAYTLRQKGMVIFLALLIITFGLYSYSRLPIDAFPDVTNIQVEVVSQADGLSAAEIERNVTYPIEMAMRGLPGIEQMRSVTKFGLSIVTIVFKDNVDIYFARQLVFERLAEAREKLPKGVEVAMGPIGTAMGEIYQYTLEGTIPTDPQQKIAYLTNLRTIQEWIVTPQLKSVAGVNEINSFGGYFKQYQVLVSPEKLVKYGLTVDDVYTAIGNNNENVGGNLLERGSDQYIVRGVGLIKDVSDIGNIVLKSVGGTPTYIRDVAEVKVGEAVRMGAAMKNGKDECVGGIVMMLRGENSREVVRRVADKVKEINKNNILPEGIKIVPYYDRSDIVKASVGTVNKALIEGSILVLIVLYLLLNSIRGSIVVLIALPLSLLATFIIMRLTGITANLMSLGGLAISIGMIIDTTIIQVENVQRHLSEAGEHHPKLTTVLKAVMEVRKPSIFGELIIAITFIPILALEGIEGKMFGPLAITVTVALLASLLLSIFIIPVLCNLILKPQPEQESFIMRHANRLYLPLLNYAMNQKRVVLGVAGALLVISLVLVTRLGTEFIPIMDEGSFDMDVAMLPGVSLTKAMEVNQRVAEKLKQFPELDTVISRTGQTGVALDTRGADKTGYVGIFKPKDQWKRDLNKDELTNRMRQALESIAGITVGFSQPIQCRIDELVAGTRAQLIVKLFGEDIAVLSEKSQEIARVLASVKGGTDLNAEKVSGQPYLTVTIDRAKIARYGLNINDVQKVIEIAVAGKAASQLYEENRSFPITVRLPEEKRNSLDAVKNLLITTKSGVNVPLEQLADVAMREGPVQISRQDGVRRIGIEMNVTGRDIGSFVAEAKQQIRQKVKLPPGYYLTWGGQFENQQRAMQRLMIIGPVAVGMILLLLYVTFRSLRLALLVISNLPFALIGGVFSLFISGQYLSVPASVGFVVLFGVAVLNGLVLVSRIAQLRDEGLGLEEAIRQGATDRLRPVLMTASIAIFSLIPMLLASGTGSEIQKPLATVVVGGLVTSTVLTLLIIPSVYSWFEKRKADEEM
ncbi:efflux RND transporter permease subunit [Trichlorobacter lovleyi]|uniref:Heavy metal efflux pump, CzcA family n=1 Tax=Trichlorobacter lovleyi (strain ATCC BAA-1151 / DSM 17278 / SZ) TaxID=398767 RepID=B3E352_TRIL1|nr:CusA/CzcA family heavy metal efflux RND transporter [Trichlorobacter lovleyi]ACD94264.1 heavy metal efflux pump, CzcA family [Trichlorobacter lovleyi SZ]QOX77759.1 efflux RND transporter permease subunit [Trichlorobacter lovleyi]